MYKTYSPRTLEPSLMVMHGRLTESLIENMMQPLEENFMEAYTVKKIAPAKVDRNDESILEPVEYPELQLI